MDGAEGGWRCNTCWHIEEDRQEELQRRAAAELREQEKHAKEMELLEQEKQLRSAKQKRMADGHEKKALAIVFVFLCWSSAIILPSIRV